MPFFPSHFVAKPVHPHSPSIFSWSSLCLPPGASFRSPTPSHAGSRFIFFLSVPSPTPDFPASFFPLFLRRTALLLLQTRMRTFTPSTHRPGPTSPLIFISLLPLCFPLWFVDCYFSRLRSVLSECLTLLPFVLACVVLLPSYIIFELLTFFTEHPPLCLSAPPFIFCPACLLPSRLTFLDLTGFLAFVPQLMRRCLSLLHIPSQFSPFFLFPFRFLLTRPAAHQCQASARLPCTSASFPPCRLSVPFRSPFVRSPWSGSVCLLFSFGPLFLLFFFFRDVIAVSPRLSFFLIPRLPGCSSPVPLFFPF